MGLGREGVIMTRRWVQFWVTGQKRLGNTAPGWVSGANFFRWIRSPRPERCHVNAARVILLRRPSATHASRPPRASRAARRWPARWRSTTVFTGAAAALGRAFNSNAFDNLAAQPSVNRTSLPPKAPRHVFFRARSFSVLPSCPRIYFFIINWFTKRRKVVTSEAPFLPRDGRNHLRYSLHTPTEGWPGWVGLSGLDIYRDGRPAEGRHQSQY